jgi:hypothetical protein
MVRYISHFHCEAGASHWARDPSVRSSSRVVTVYLVITQDPCNQLQSMIFSCLTQPSRYLLTYIRFLQPQIPFIHVIMRKNHDC